MTKLPDCSDADFESTVLKRTGPVLVTFGAPWCSPCRAIEPDLIAIAEAGQAHVVKVNVDENPRVAGQLGVRAMPTLILFRGGNPVKQLVGKQSRASVETMLDDG